MDRLKTGLKLAVDSLLVLRDYPKLAVFPLLGVGAALVFIVFLFVPIPFLMMDYPITVVLGFLFLVYFTTTFATTYFTAALVHASNEAFHGRAPSIKASTKAVSSSLGPILVWSVISASVSIVFRTIELFSNVDHPIALVFALLRVVLVIGWSVMTFFIVPVIVFQKVTVTSMFTESMSVFKETWGETITASFGVSVVASLVTLVLLLPAIIIGRLLEAAFPMHDTLYAASLSSLGPTHLVIHSEVLYLVFLLPVAICSYLFSQTIWGIAKTALYLYAREGLVPEQFDNFDFETLDGRTETEATPNTNAGKQSQTPFND